MDKLLADSEIRDFVTHLSYADADSVETLALLMWSYLTEPGDMVAGALINAFGAAESMQQLLAAQGAKPFAGWATGDVKDDDTDIATRSLYHGYKRWQMRFDFAGFKESLATGVKHGMQILTRHNSIWPKQVNSLAESAPLVLWVQGDGGLLKKSGVAVVGSRAVSGYGKRVTCDFTASIAKTGVPVLSGGAYGVDATAHRTALQLGCNTVAVMAGGLDRVYPVAHTDLVQEIIANGVVCSEMLPGSAPTRWRFLQRNRVLAALSAGVLVTEASSRSGSMNTARHALELGRFVGAVPGNVLTADAVGCHQLISEHQAALIISGDNAVEFTKMSLQNLVFSGLLEEAATDDIPPTQHNLISDTVTVSDKPSSNSVRVRIEDALSRRDYIPLEKIAEISGVECQEVKLNLNELELLGVVERKDTGGVVKWRKTKSK